VLSGRQSVASHGILAHSDEPSRAPRSATFAQVVQDIHRLARRQPKSLQDRAASLGEDSLARHAVDHSDVLPTPAPAAEAEVTRASLPAVGTTLPLAAERVYRVRRPIVLVTDGPLRSCQRAINRTLITSSGGKP
jgi:hypothetical protein